MGENGDLQKRTYYLTCEDEKTLIAAVRMGKAATKSDALRTAIRDYRIKYKIETA